MPYADLKIPWATLSVPGYIQERTKPLEGLGKYQPCRTLPSGLKACPGLDIDIRTPEMSGLG